MEMYNERGDTPLICAVRGGAIDVVEEQIENNINVRQCGFMNETALMVAAQFDNAEIGEILATESGQYTLYEHSLRSSIRCSHSLQSSGRIKTKK